MASNSASMVSDPNSTQAPWSFRSSLPALGISFQRDALIAKYNRRLIPIVDDEAFYHKLQQAAKNGGSNQIEDEIALSLMQENAQSYEGYMRAKFELGMDGLECFQTEAQQFSFLNGLRTHTIHGFEGIISHCLPSLVQACRSRSHQQSNTKGRSKGVRKRTAESSKLSRKGVVQQEVSKPRHILRRSARLRDQKMV